MKKITFGSLVLFILIESLFTNDVLSWDDDTTHKTLSEYAADNSVLSKSKNKGDYLKNFGFNKGLDENFKLNETTRKVKEWLSEGAKLEDDAGPLSIGYLNGKARAYNHFHNPMKPWDSAGLDDWILLPPFHVTGKSSLLWAQDGTYQQDKYEGDWSWQTILNYYYLALTSTTDTERQAYFAQTFRGLGHQLHLIEDAAQPDHVRNDAHPEDSTLRYNIFGSLYFEEWAKENPDFSKCLLENHATLPPDILSKCQQFGINESVNIDNYFPEISLNISYNNKVPITQFIDTDQYTNTPSTSLTQGIAEYTNANFFSDDTIFAAERYDTTYRHYFSYPKRSSTDLDAYIAGTKPAETIIEEDGSADTGIWISKTSDGEITDHFVRPSFLSGFVYSLLGEGSLYYKTFYRDEKCHEDYAQKLIPRAVGYSAGLLNYFFRGQLEATRVYGGLTIKNINQETMASYTDSITGNTIGSISIYYDDTNNNRRLLAEYPLTTPLAPGEETPVISFIEPNDNTKPGRYIVVFHGKLGNEEGAVIGKVTSPIQIYYASKRNGIYKIYKMDTDGNNQTIVYDNTNLSIQIAKLAPSPDGKTLAFTVSGPQIYLLGLTDGSIRKLADGDWPSWSPDGKKIVFQRETGQYLPSYGDVELFIKDIETGIETQLTNISGSSYSGQPAWSPDGNNIAYMKFDPYDTECLSSTYYIIYRIDTSGNAIGPVTCHKEGEPYLDSAPAWSPDGQSIGFTRRRYGGSYKEALYKVDMATQTATKLTDSTGEVYSEFTPDWSHDGKSITISSNRDGDFDIWLVDPNGGGYIKNLTNSNPDIDGYPAFGE